MYYNDEELDVVKAKEKMKDDSHCHVVVGILLMAAGIFEMTRGLFLFCAGFIFIANEIDWSFLDKKNKEVKEQKDGSGDVDLTQEDHRQD